MESSEEILTNKIFELIDERKILNEKINEMKEILLEIGSQTHKNKKLYEWYQNNNGTNT